MLLTTKLKKKMKKLMIMAAFLLATISASAQVYIGGGVSFHSTKPQTVEGVDVDTKTAISILPEIGYKLEDNLSIGIGLGYSHSKQGDRKDDAFSIEPYIRYTFAKWNKVGFFGEAGFGYQHTKNSVEKEIGNSTLETSTKENTWYIGVRPGISIDVTDNFTFITKIGWLGYQSTKEDVDKAKASSDFGLDLSGSNIQFSLLYNF